MSDRFGSLPELIKKLKETTKFRNILLTQGELGCLYIKDDNTYSGPSLTNSVKDVVGAGDAVFAITCLLNHKNVDEDLLVFIANCVGGIAVNTIGNKESVTREKLIEFARDVYSKVE